MRDLPLHCLEMLIVQISFGQRQLRVQFGEREASGRSAVSEERAAQGEGEQLTKPEQ